MNSSHLQLNQPIWVCPEEGSSSHWPGHVIGLDHEVVRIAFPHIETLPFLKAQNVLLQMQAASCLMRAPSSVEEISNEPAVMRLRVSGEFERIQRRSNFRVHAKRDMRFCVLNRQATRLPSYASMRGQLMDISTSGLRLNCDVELRVGDSLSVRVPMSSTQASQASDDVMHLTAEVVWTVPGDHASHAAGVKFTDVSSAHADRLTSLMFQLQRPS